MLRTQMVAGEVQHKPMEVGEELHKTQAEEAAEVVLMTPRLFLRRHMLFSLLGFVSRLSQRC